jgi:hypothetical protein
VISLTTLPEAARPGFKPFELDAACGDELVVRRVSPGRAIRPSTEVRENALGSADRQMIRTNAAPRDELRQAGALHGPSIVAAWRPGVPKMGGRRRV